ncbi:MAG: hypothetical protein Q7S50_02940 [bacterium]|nr:hypothetical protein [bacterium]
MDWTRTHPYVSALCGAGILLVVGAFIVERQKVALPATQITAWGGAGNAYLDPASYVPTSGASPYAEDIMQRVKSGPPYTYTPPLNAPRSGASGEHSASQNVLASDSFNFDDFVAMLVREGARLNTAPASGDIPSAYAFIPSGLVSTTTSTSARTDLQQELYSYGNDIGSSIESFEQQHSNMMQILKGQVEDRTDQGKAEAVVNLAHSFQNLGNNLAGMDNVPLKVAGTHKALTQSYIEIGTNLALVPKAERDSDFIHAIEKYNASADTFTKNYIALASLFGAYGVAFSSSDAGSVFTFTPMGL